MSGESRCLRKRGSTLSVILALTIACFVWTACDGDGGTDSSGSSGPFQLTFALDGSFQDPHGGHQIRMALVRYSDWFVVAQANGMVSATQNPSFAFDFGAVLEKGVAYAVHYWIDSNFGGGALKVCDPKEIDHQWSTEFPSPSNDVTFTASYNAWLTEDVCDTFN